MQPKDYLLQRLTQLKEPVEVPEYPDVATAIYRFVMSKKFRKYAVDKEYEAHIHSAIETNIQNNEPIKFTLVFGGYKLWRFEESPEVDWAELFSLIYYTNWINPIAQVYKPGVWFDFYSDDAIVERMNGTPKSETAAYNRSFHELLEFLKPYLLENISFTLNRVGDQYENEAAFHQDVDTQMAALKQSYSGSLPPLSEEQIAAIDLNVRTKPEGVDWREQVQLIHEAYSKVTKRRPYYRTPDKLMVSTRPIPASLAVGTTKSSVVKFWIGVGALKKAEDTFKEVILSPTQVAEAPSKLEEIALAGLSGKNFRVLRIVE
jgi:hypothetical protein